MERSRMFCKNRMRCVTLLVTVANIFVTGLLSESHVILSDDVLNATFGQNTLEANRQTSNQLTVRGQLKFRHFERVHEAQDLQRHRRKLRPKRVTDVKDVKRNRSFSDNGGQDNSVIKIQDPSYKVLEYVIGQEDGFENSGEMRGVGRRAKGEEAPSSAAQEAPSSAGLQLKLTLHPVDGDYDEEQLKAMADEHEEEMDANFFCHSPLPEVICIRSRNTDMTKDYFPECTVVFRCRPRSGCCANGLVCSVRSSTSIIKAFREISNVDKSSSVKIRLFRFTNHTDCTCKPITDFDDDCLECPESFQRRRRESGRCECYCDLESHSYKLCLSETQGMRRLTESDLKCIEHNNCSNPPCANGTFNRTTGFCPCNRQKKKCETLQNISLRNGLNNI